MRGSAHFGFTKDWYNTRGQFWVIRTLQIERPCAAHYPDELSIRTWVSSMGRVRSDRDYEITRVRDGGIIARAIANWVFVDYAKRVPVRIPAEISSIFEPADPPILAPIGKVTLDSTAPALFARRSVRRAQFYEADSALHINNAVCVDWIEGAVREALGAMGYHFVIDASAPHPWFYRHELEYLQSCLPGDEIAILARLLRRGQAFGDWAIEMNHVASNQPLVHARTTMLWRDRHAHARPLDTLDLTSDRKIRP